MAVCRDSDSDSDPNSDAASSSGNGYISDRWVACVILNFWQSYPYSSTVTISCNASPEIFDRHTRISRWEAL